VSVASLQLASTTLEEMDSAKERTIKSALRFAILRAGRTLSDFNDMKVAANFDYDRI
jgi:hypothetical protein